MKIKEEEKTTPNTNSSKTFDIASMPCMHYILHFAILSVSGFFHALKFNEEWKEEI